MVKNKWKTNKGPGICLSLSLSLCGETLWIGETQAALQLKCSGLHCVDKVKLESQGRDLRKNNCVRSDAIG